jgi:tRNA G18 (ribose-2'-O)-methylase SpoU
MKQLDHYSSLFTKRTLPVTLVCEQVTNAPNVGSLFRAADAFGIEKLVFCGEHIPLGRKMTKTSRATEKSVNFEITNNALEVVTELKDKGYQVVALEITSTSTSIYSHKFSKDQPIALIIGDENFGISENILKLSDSIIHIDMFGQNSSMNVVQATSITLYEITRQLFS